MHACKWLREKSVQSCLWSGVAFTGKKNRGDFVLQIFCALRVQTYPYMPRQCGGKESTCQYGRKKRCRFQSLGQEDPLEQEMAIHSSILAWRIPWTGEPCGLQSMGSQRVGHYCVWVQASKAYFQTYQAQKLMNQICTFCSKQFIQFKNIF